MTEHEWLECTNPRTLLYALETMSAQKGDRKLRLFAVACCHRVWDHLQPVVQKSVALTERHADGLAETAELEQARGERAEILRLAVDDDTIGAALLAADVPEEEKMCEALNEGRNADIVQQSEQIAISVLLRHIVGNPFRPNPAPPFWPSSVVKLAEALYAGEDGSFALRDALLEAGHADLAGHFTEKDHPKGCWAVDFILGRS